MMDMNSLRPKGGRKDYHQNDSCSFRPKGRGHDQQNLKPTNALVKADSSRRYLRIHAALSEEVRASSCNGVLLVPALIEILNFEEGASAVETTLAEKRTESELT